MQFTFDAEDQLQNTTAKNDKALSKGHSASPN
jgi:hypothetical protein